MQTIKIYEEFSQSTHSYDDETHNCRIIYKQGDLEEKQENCQSKIVLKPKTHNHRITLREHLPTFKQSNQQTKFHVLQSFKSNDRHRHIDGLTEITIT